MITELQQEQLKMLNTMQHKTLVMMHKGLYNIEIAEALNRTTKTVEGYVSAVYAILGVRNRVLAALFYERSLLP